MSVVYGIHERMGLLLRSATQFVRGASEHNNPTELLEALQRVGQKHRQGLRVQCAWALSAFQMNPTLNSSVFFHPDFPGEQLLKERREQFGMGSHAVSRERAALI